MEISPAFAKAIVAKLMEAQPLPVALLSHDGSVLADSEPWLTSFELQTTSTYFSESAQNDLLSENTAFSQNHTTYKALLFSDSTYIILAVHSESASSVPNLKLMQTIIELMCEQIRGVQVSSDSSLTARTLAAISGTHPKDCSKLLRDIELCKIDLSIPRTLVYISLLQPQLWLNMPSLTREINFNPLQFNYSSEYFLKTLGGYFSHKDDLISIDFVHNSALLLCADRSNEDDINALRLYSLCESVCQYAFDEYNLEAKCIIGPHCCCFQDYNGQYDQLVLRMESGQLLFPNQRVMFGHKMVLGNIVVHIPDAPQRNIVEYTFGNLFKCAQSDVLFETLQTYFSCNMSVTQTAKALFIHRNTLQYRFKQIEQLTGYSVYDTDGLVLLRMAMLCHNALLNKQLFKK